MAQQERGFQINLELQIPMFRCRFRECSGFEDSSVVDENIDAFELFEDEFRTAESFFAVIASIGGVNLIRTHEIARVRPVLQAMRLA